MITADIRIRADTWLPPSLAPSLPLYLRPPSPIDASTQLPAANSGGDVDREGQIDEEDYLTLRVVMELVSVTAHLYKKGPALVNDKTNLQ